MEVGGASGKGVYAVNIVCCVRCLSQATPCSQLCYSSFFNFNNDNIVCMQMYLNSLTEYNVFNSNCTQ